ncbi:hypothetical protein SS1G_07560 [Sclerotinia sclerotiorum 1980 UF-70]|uniref:Uncharacterized protein n=1 Tax=Sclerotinia sclerotiorum (strain ATCC 18683 / 1980 / Ss-1) TaxID=665079 RepID=A7EQF8_SCLS1|nr:hypothetical protein SS1G_07560 [Sclerotinia sclerotiorum 1980 UF-70]EDN91700.1 hypothetical protein SS1G_07560 [Sclerotinia sclerotiorum 1980 UF-70]
MAPPPSPALPLQQRLIQLAQTLQSMAIVWLFSKQYPIAMLPFGVYSVFHVATYTRTNLIPTLQPAPQSTDPKAAPKPNAMADTIGKFAQSTFVQAQFRQLEARIDSLVGAQSTPPAARQVWEGLKGGARTFHDTTDIGKYVGGAPAQKKTS